MRDTILTFILWNGTSFVLVLGVCLALIRLTGTTWIQESIKSAFQSNLELHKATLQAQNALSLEDFKAELQQQHARMVQQMQIEAITIAAQKEADKALFERFLKALPSEWITRFIYNRSPAEPFDGQELDPLYDFRRDWKDEEHTFLDSELEMKRKEVFEAASEYNCQIAHTIGPYERSPEMTCLIPFEIKNSSRYGEVLDAIQKRADALHKSHQEFIALARKKLNC